MGSLNKVNLSNQVKSGHKYNETTNVEDLSGAGLERVDWVASQFSRF